MSKRGDFTADRRLAGMAVCAIGVGLVSTGVAWLLLRMIAGFTNLFYYGELSVAPRAPSDAVWGVAAIAVPVVGGLIIGLMARYGSEQIRGHGIPEALEAILFNKSLMKPKVAVLKPLSSAISIGSGGPFGAEGPIIMTGGAFASMIAQSLYLTAAERKSLLVAGEAAGMTAVFNTPIAAVLLAVELLLFEWRPRSLIPVAVASSVAAIARPWILGSGALFPITPHAALPTAALVISAGVGLIAGAFATGISNLLYRLEDQFARLKLRWMWWPALGGLAVGIGGYFEPRALGVGYDLIEQLLRGEIGAHAVLGLLVVKALIWLVALASGTSGGVLAPLLIMGAGLGVLESTVIPSGDASLWALVSMAAVLGGMMRSPFTAVLFALELTQDLQSLLPLLIASIASYGLTVLWMKRSILTEKVARRGYDLTREYRVDPLDRMSVREIMTSSPVTIPATSTVDEALLRYFTGARPHQSYPVVDERGALIGLLTSKGLLEAANRRGEIRSMQVGAWIGGDPLIVAYPDDSCRDAAERMAQNGVGRLPVVSREDPRALVGIVTRSDLLKARRRELEEEGVKERYLRFGF